MLSEKLADASLKFENSVFSRGSQIQNPIIQSRVWVDAD